MSLQDTRSLVPRGALVAIPLSLWVGLQIGFERDALLAGCFLIVIPIGLLAVVILTRHSRPPEKKPDESSPKK